MSCEWIRDPVLSASGYNCASHYFPGPPACAVDGAFPMTVRLKYLVSSSAYADAFTSFFLFSSLFCWESRFEAQPRVVHFPSIFTERIPTCHVV